MGQGQSSNKKEIANFRSGFEKTPDDVLKRSLTPTLDLASLNQLVATSRRSQGLFKEAISVNGLLRLLATYEITKNMEDKFSTKMLQEKIHYQISADGKQVAFNTYGVGMQVKNPVIRLAYIIMKKHPELINKLGHVPLANKFAFKNCSPVEYICRSANFIMMEVISQLIPGGREQIAAVMTALKKEETNYDIVLMPTLLAGKTITDINNRMILLPACGAVPSDIPENTVVLKMEGNEIITYRMGIQDEQENFTVAINSGVAQPLTSSVSSLDASESSSVIKEVKAEQANKDNLDHVISYFSTLKEQQEITPDKNPELFESLRSLCDYLIPLPNKPALILQIDKYGDSKLIQWGKMNGSWQSRELIGFSDVQPELAAEDIEPARGQLHVELRGNSIKCNIADMCRPLVITKEELNNQDISSLKKVNLLKNDIIKILSAKIGDKIDYTLLTDEEEALFMQLPFPHSHGQTTIMPSDNITAEHYAVLKKGQPVIYDLGQNNRSGAAFIAEYPVNISVPENLMAEHDRNAAKLVRLPQMSMHAWLAQVWCSRTPFSPIPNFIETILSTKIKDLKLHLGDNFFDCFDYLSGFIVKGDEVKSEPLPPYCSYPRTFFTVLDLTAISALYEVVTEELDKFKQLLPTQPTLGLAAR